MTVLLAVSGGADSVALLRGVHALAEQAASGGGRIVVAHLNHRLRGDQSDADEAFVVELCRQLGLRCIVGRAETDKLATAGEGLESAARSERYAFLQRTAEELGARLIATAHTADDQAETILHHVIRGTGLAGLAGIPRARALGQATTLIRPLLSIARSQVIDYLQSLGQPYCIDATNAHLDFTRNRIRHDLLPRLKRDYSPTIEQSLIRLGQLAAEAQGVVATKADELLDACLASDNLGAMTLDCRRLADRPLHLVREVFVRLWRRSCWPMQAMDYSRWNQLAELALGDVDGKLTLPGTVLAERRGQQMAIGPRPL